EVDRFTKNWGGFGKTIGVHVETNALLGKISPGIEGAGEIKQKIGEMVTQKKTVVKNKNGYPKLVFKEGSKHGERRGTRESEEHPRTGCQVLEVFKEDYSLLEESRDMHIPEENNWFQDE
ncbi:MAG: uncharacterized protein A8A55_3642, partial [Amphiamblys sp. WSBS2006]